MTWNTDAEPAPYRDNLLPHATNKARPTTADAVLEFGRFRVLLRRRELLADAAPIELGTRAFDLLLVLAEADGSLVTKSELMTRVWPGVTVSEENLKVQINALRRALGKDRDFIRTEFGRGYRFTAPVYSMVDRSAGHCPARRRRLSQGLRSGSISRRPLCRRSGRNRSDGRFDPAHAWAVAHCKDEMA